MIVKAAIRIHSLTIVKWTNKEYINQACDQQETKKEGKSDHAPSPAHKPRPSTYYKYIF